MQIKRMTLRFDLDNPEDRQAWEYLRGLNPASMNRAVLAIVNQAEQTARISGMVRSIIREELCRSYDCPLFEGWLGLSRHSEP